MELSSDTTVAARVSKAAEDEFDKSELNVLFILN